MVKKIRMIIMINSVHTEEKYSVLTSHRAHSRLFWSQSYLSLTCQTYCPVSITHIRLYLLKLLQSQGLSTAQLDQVSQAIIVSRQRTVCLSGLDSCQLISLIEYRHC